jgi:GH35 family endo-1,4-beta-xylanase
MQAKSLNVRLRLLLTLLALLLPAPAAALHAAELLRNPDFATSADGHLADGWSDGSSALPRPADFSFTAEGPDGRSCQKIVLGPLQGGRFRLRQTVVAPPPGLYRMRARVRVSGAVQVEVVLRTPGEAWTTWGNAQETPPAGEWRDVVGYARVPPGAGECLFVLLFNDPGTMWIAAAGLEPVDEHGLAPAERARVERLLGPALPPVDEARVLAETDARIQASRTAPLSVYVMDAAGQPAAGARVRVEHVRQLFWFGAGFDWNLLPGHGETRVDELHREGFLRLFNAATVQFQSEYYESEPGVYRDAECLQAIGWLETQGLRIAGHPLFWNLTSPPWLAQAAPTKDQVRRWMDRLLAHASNTILPRFSRVVVFNEAVTWDRFSTPMTAVLAGSGKAAVMAEYLRRFKGLNPGVAAMINDYDTSPAYYWLLRDVIDAGGPVDAIGLQSHMQGGVWPVAQLWMVLNRLALLGRPVYFTELSVSSGAPRAFNFRPANPPWPTTPEGEAAQADDLEQFYRLVYSHPAAAGIVYWDYADRSAWLGCPVGLLRPDGSPKPAWFRLDRLINQTWRTRGEFRTDAEGRLVVPHAFEGEYRLLSGTGEARGEHRADRPLNAIIRLPR